MKLLCIITVAKEWQATLNKIAFQDIDYTEKLSNELIKDYIFGLSDKHARYLEHIKARSGNLACKREKMKKKKLDKQIKKLLLKNMS